MPKRIILVHRWHGNPNDDWYPWLKKMLIERNYEVLIPTMPNTDEPHISAWVPCLSKEVGEADSDTYFIGHSIGCQTIIRYLESLEDEIEIGGAVFVAGWFNLIEGSLDPDEVNTSKEWINTPIDFAEVRKHLQKSVAVFSDNDPYVPVSNSKIFESELGSRIILHPKRGHFTSEDNVSELHVALNEIQKLAK
jgi:serine hydrolase